MKKMVVIILMLAMGTGMLTGCEGSAAKQETDSMKREENIVITMVKSLTSPDRTAIIREVADKYEQEHPSISIETISPPLENADNKITQMLMSGPGVDIVETRDLTITRYVNNQWIQPLDQWLDQWENKDILTSVASSAIYKTGDKAYLIPYGSLWRGLYCRADWLKESNLELPKTWQDIHDAGAELTDSSKDRFGLALRGSTLRHQYADTMIWSYIGTDLLANPDAGYYLKGKEGETTFTLPETKEVLEFYKSLYTDCSPKDSIAWGFAEMVQGFADGITVMLIQGPEVIAFREADMSEEQWELIQFPVDPSEQAVFPNELAGWAMTSSTERPDEVSDFILYLSNPESNTYFAKNYATIPIYPNAPELDSFFKEGRFSIYMDMAEKGEVYCCATQLMMYNAYATYKTNVDMMYQKQLTEEISMDGLLEWLDDFRKDAYQQEGRKY